jgi:hypothetical protein
MDITVMKVVGVFVLVAGSTSCNIYYWCAETWSLQHAAILSSTSLTLPPHVASMLEGLRLTQELAYSQT